MLIKIASEKYGVIFAGGQEKLAGRIVRMAHLGYCDDLDVITGISALEMALLELGYDMVAGSGVRAAEESFGRHRI